MKIYKEYKDTIKKIGTLKKAYFTTFNLDIDFVERYILPPLLKKSSIKSDKKSVLQDKEELNTELYKQKYIKIFYDASMLKGDRKQTVVDIKAVKQLGGVFHPKVIYLEGDKKSFLIVGSGNLTVNGWGRNIEAFDIVEIKTNNLEHQVLNFFDDVFEKAGLKRVNKRLRPTNIVTNNINFLYSHNKENAIFLDALHLDKNLQIYSPYFSPLDELFDENEFKTLENIKIVPDLIQNQKIRLENKPKDQRIRFYRLDKEQEEFQNQDESLNHSKIWISDIHIAIGSYNCTNQALFGTNFEAALVRPYENIGELELKDEFKDIVFSTKEQIDDEDNIDNTKRFTRVFELVADYKEQILKLYEIRYENSNIIKESPKQSSHIDLKLPTYNKYISYKIFSKFSKSDFLPIINQLVNDKRFEVYNDDKLIYGGFIDEINANEKNRFPVGASSLEELFSLADAENPTISKKLSNKIISYGSDTQLYKKQKLKPKDNYFEMFSHFKNLRNRYEKIKDDNKKIEIFCFKSISSLIKLRQLLEIEKNNERLYIYLAIDEFNSLIRKQKIKGIKEIENIKIKLTKKDKEFIGKIKWK